MRKSRFSEEQNRRGVERSRGRSAGQGTSAAGSVSVTPPSTTGRPSNGSLEVSETRRLDQLEEESERLKSSCCTPPSSA
jgi:hypothetical protein